MKPDDIEGQAIEGQAIVAEEKAIKGKAKAKAEEAKAAEANALPPPQGMYTIEGVAREKERENGVRVNKCTRGTLYECIRRPHATYYIFKW